MASVSPPPVAAPDRAVKVALIGNPNAGKSTLFNALAGMNARVGNYPGVTVEKKIGRVKRDGRAFELIELPGTYRLVGSNLRHNRDRPTGSPTTSRRP
jgi:ferrous iron transport protein B